MASLQGPVYRLIIDPFLGELRQRIRDLVPEGASVIEAACGTGAQTFLLAPKASRVLAFDLNPEMVHYAGRRAGKHPARKVKVIQADGRNLGFLPDDEFDAATISLAIHEMPEENRVPVLTELRRVAGLLVIGDYSAPLPVNWTGGIIKVIERIAGGDHYRGFRSYQDHGGLDSYLDKAGWTIEREDFVMNGTLRVLVCKRREAK